ncbi:hypothetical protein [Mycobacterium sp. MFM001]|uniref:hypothetical protein n=1 Tax=Mycobacterium sp. MFM001 TaxID=2049453 RepID=UPI000E2F8D4E|nr:hypothetical protein [Mycobacterium sp. MFM001]
MIWSIVAGIVIVGAIVIAQRPWESHDYKDCITANQGAVGGIATPAYTQKDLETYCAQTTGR